MAADIQLRLTGGAANADPDASLGGVMSSEQVSAVALNNLFDNVEPAEAVAGDAEYRAIDLYNNGDAAAVSVKIFMKTETASPKTQLDLALDATTQTVLDEDTAPSNPALSFAHHTSANKLAVSDIPAAGAQRVWLKRIVTAGADNLANDLGTLSVEYA